MLVKPQLDPPVAPFRQYFWPAAKEGLEASDRSSTAPAMSLVSSFIMISVVGCASTTGHAAARLREVLMTAVAMPRVNTRGIQRRRDGEGRRGDISSRA